MNVINVEYEVAGSPWKHTQLLKSLEHEPLLGFDTETCGLYSKEERKQAEQLLESDKLIPSKKRAEYRMIAGNSGLSFPSLVRTTHFIFGLRNDYSIVFVTTTSQEELRIWNWIKNYKGRLLIHNTLFDLKIMYNRVKTYPKNYTDTALLTKTLINNANNFKSLIGLKELVGSSYKASWSTFDAYEPDNLFDKDFIDYAAIDGAAVMMLWEELQEFIEK